ncbi:hypothetical protein [Metallosphaera hakonensis]|nr:hypothetical protein [Metallosphaera hakonensis]
MDQEVHRKLQELADKKKMSLYDYTNYLLESALEIENSGVGLENLKELMIVLGRIAQNYKGIIVIAPFSTLSTPSEWRDLGKRLGIIAKESFSNERDSVIKMCKSLLQVFGYVQEASNYVRVVSPSLMSDNTLNNLKELLEGILESSSLKGSVFWDKGIIGIKFES